MGYPAIVHLLGRLGVTETPHVMVALPGRLRSSRINCKPKGRRIEAELESYKKCSDVGACQ